MLEIHDKQKNKDSFHNLLSGDGQVTDGDIIIAIAPKMPNLSLRNAPRCIKIIKQFKIYLRKTMASKTCDY